MKFTAEFNWPSPENDVQLYTLFDTEEEKLF